MESRLPLWWFRWAWILVAVMILGTALMLAVGEWVVGLIGLAGAAGVALGIVSVKRSSRVR